MSSSTVTHKRKRRPQYEKINLYHSSHFYIGKRYFLSLGLTCLLNLLSISVGISLDSKIQYPRFIPFCIILGIVALIGVIFLLFGNIKISERLNFTKWLWCFQYIFAFVLSIPMIKLWQMLFDFLQETI